MKIKDDKPIISFSYQEKWERWLSINTDSLKEIAAWIGKMKKMWDQNLIELKKFLKN